MRVWLAGEKDAVLHLPRAPRTLLGRDPFLCDITVCKSDDTLVGRVHAVVVRAQYGTHNEMLCIADLGSTNGTFVNCVLLEKYRPQPLQDGDHLSFGSPGHQPFTLHCEPSHNFSKPGAVDAHYQQPSRIHQVTPKPNLGPRQQSPLNASTTLISISESPVESIRRQIRFSDAAIAETQVEPQGLPMQGMSNNQTTETCCNVSPVQQVVRHAPADQMGLWRSPRQSTPISDISSRFSISESPVSGCTERESLPVIPQTQGIGQAQLSEDAIGEPSRKRPYLSTHEEGAHSTTHQSPLNGHPLQEDASSSCHSTPPPAKKVAVCPSMFAAQCTVMERPITPGRPTLEWASPLEELSIEDSDATASVNSGMDGGQHL